MAEAFDPYYRWLGIPPKDQPPNHYRLLGIELFEPALDVIEAAADRQMSHLRAFQTGKHAAESQRLLNEVATARVCLLKPATKAAYDQQLRASLEAQRSAAAPAAEEAPAAAWAFLGQVEPAAEGSAVRRAASSKRPPVLIYLGVAAAAVLILIVLAWGLRPSGRHGAARATVEPAPAQPSYLVLDWPAPQREGATLEIDQRPRQLTEGGIRVGPQRVELPLEPGRHTVRIRRPGFEAFVQSLEIAGENRTLTPVWIAVAQAPSSKAAVSEKEPPPPPAPTTRPKAGGEATVTIPANSERGYELGPVKRETTVIFQYVGGKWKSWGRFATANPDADEVEHGEKCRLAIAAAPTAGGPTEVVCVVPPGTRTKPFTWRADRDYDAIVLRINDSDHRWSTRPGSVQYKITIQLPADARAKREGT